MPDDLRGGLAVRAREVPLGFFAAAFRVVPDEALPDEARFAGAAVPVVPRLAAGLRAAGARFAVAPPPFAAAGFAAVRVADFAAGFAGAREAVFVALAVLAAFFAVDRRVELPVAGFAAGAARFAGSPLAAVPPAEAAPAAGPAPFVAGAEAGEDDSFAGAGDAPAVGCFFGRPPRPLGRGAAISSSYSRLASASSTESSSVSRRRRRSSSAR